MKLFEVLEQQLKKEPNFVTDDGELKKWVVLNKAQNFDEELIGLLLDNDELKDKFFVKVNDTLIFKQNLFSQFLEQKNYLNDSYTQFKNKVGLTIDSKYLNQRNKIALVWPFTTHRDKKILKQKDYIHIYSNEGIKSINPQYTKRDSWDTHFSRILDKETLEVTKLPNELINKGLLPEGSSNSDIDINNKNIREYYLENKESIFQTQPSISEEGKKLSLANKNKVVKYSENPDEYALNGRRLVFLEDSIYELDTGEEDLAILLCDFWSDIDFQNTQNEGGVSFPAGKKPESLLRRIIYLFTKEDDIIMDFFNGSGTTTSTALKLKRQFVGIEQLNYGDNDSVTRLINTINGDKSGISESINWQGGGSFTYLELKKYNQTFIEQIEDADDSQELIFIWEDMKDKSFLNYNVDIKKQDEQMDKFEALSLTEQKQHLCEILDKNQLYVNLSSLNDKDFECTDKEKAVTKDFYQIKD